MNKLMNAPRQIATSRLIRLFIDGLVLLLVFYFFLEIRTASIEQSQTQSQKASLHKLSTQNQVSNKLKDTQALLFIEERHSTEATLWQAWESWLQSTNPSTGHCLFDTRNAEPTQPYYLLCFGNSTGKIVLNKMENERWFQESLFVEPQGAVADNIKNEAKPKLKKNIDKTAEQQAESTYKVQGWINTSQGQKTFDPIQKKWVP